MGEVADPEYIAYVGASYPRMLRAAALMCGDVHRAEDLVQDAMIKLAAHWERVRRGSPDAYVRKIIYHDAISSWRRLRREIPTDDLPDSVGECESDAWGTAQDVRAALQRLTPRQRAVLVLRYYEDFTEAQTAGVLGVSVGTVKSRTHLALARLREQMPALDLVEPGSAHRGENQ